MNTAYLENGTYEEIVQHLERELELNGLEGDNAPAITISTTQNAESRPPRDLSNVECYFCKEKGHFARDCPRLKKRKEKEQQNSEPSKPKRTFPPCGHCGLTNHSTERCYRNPENRNRRETNNDDQPSTSRGGAQGSGVDKNVLNNPLHLN